MIKRWEQFQTEFLWSFLNKSLYQNCRSWTEDTHRETLYNKQEKITDFNVSKYMWLSTNVMTKQDGKWEIDKRYVFTLYGKRKKYKKKFKARNVII